MRASHVIATLRTGASGAVKLFTKKSLKGGCIGGSKAYNARPQSMRLRSELPAVIQRLYRNRAAIRIYQLMKSPVE